MPCGPAGRSANKINLIDSAGRFLLDREDAEVIFTRVTDIVRASWHATMRRTGVSDDDCAAIRSAFVYDGLFYETEASNA